MHQEQKTTTETNIYYMITYYKETITTKGKRVLQRDEEELHEETKKCRQRHKQHKETQNVTWELCIKHIQTLLYF